MATLDDVADAGSTQPYVGIGAAHDFSQRVGVGLNRDRPGSGGDGDGVDVTAKTLTAGVDVRFRGHPPGCNEDGRRKAAVVFRRAPQRRAAGQIV